MFSFLGSPRVLGIDIGTTSIKAVELMRTKKEIRLVNYGILQMFEKSGASAAAIQTSSLRFLEPQVIKLLKSLIKKMKANPAHVVASLPAFSVFTTLIELPKMSEEETTQAMPYQSRQYIPAPLSTVSIEWIPIGERRLPSGEILQQCFVSSTPNDIIEKYKKAFAGAGIRLDVLEIENMSIARALSSGDAEPVLIIDIGARSTSFTVAKNGLAAYVAQTDFAGASLTQVLSQSLGLAPWRAEKIKLEQGLLGRGGEKELSTVLKPILDVILNEAKRVSANFAKSYGKVVHRIIVTGGSAGLLGIREYIERETGLPVSFAEPMKELSLPKALRSLLPEISPSLTVATGLALRRV